MLWHEMLLLMRISTLSDMFFSWFRKHTGKHWMSLIQWGSQILYWGWLRGGTVLIIGLNMQAWFWRSSLCSSFGGGKDDLLLSSYVCSAFPPDAFFVNVISCWKGNEVIQRPSLSYTSIKLAVYYLGLLFLKCSAPPFSVDYFVVYTIVFSYLAKDVLECDWQVASLASWCEEVLFKPDFS